MTTRIHREYFKRETADVAKFVDALKENGSKNGTFDSVGTEDFISQVTNASVETTGVKIPQGLQHVFDEAGKDEKIAVTKAILDSCDSYEKNHGCEAPADLIETAIHSAFSTTQFARDHFKVFDSAADSMHAANTSLQPNRAVVAIITTIAEAIPFAHYLPADISSNEARLAILTHRAGTTYGAYAQNDVLDGVASGDPYITSSRVHTMNPGSDGTVKGKLTKTQTDGDTCNQSGDAVKLLRGRTMVYVDGRIAAREIDSTGSGNSSVSGNITIGDTNYAIGGTINTDDGTISLTTSPNMPQTCKVVVEGFIDYERAPELTPSIISAVDTYRLYAKPWRVLTRQTIDTRTQMANELGLDPYSESIVAMQAQFGNERHYDALRKGMRLAQMNTEVFDFAQAISHQDVQRAEAWRDLSYPLGVVSQRMAELTMNHGVTHLYVGKRVAAQLMAMPSTVFQPAGIAARPGIYRLGRLFGQYEVYYTPKVIKETADSSQILCVGRATDVTRNPIVLGDAVAPMVVPLGVMGDLRQGAAFYARNFTEVNPHDASSKGFALIDVTNLAG